MDKTDSHTSSYANSYTSTPWRPVSSQDAELIAQAAERVIIQAAQELEAQGQLGQKQLARIIRENNRELPRNDTHVAKKHLIPHYRRQKKTDSCYWEKRGISGTLEEALMQAFQVKPRRTASGVATISVITKPGPCASNCIYCPNDLRMPKSYIADEPACQRAERNWFDPYLQVAARLQTLEEMGHVTDKVELIILGGSWTDYSLAYQCWFIAELFRALNEAGTQKAGLSRDERSKHYEQLGLARSPEQCAAFVQTGQQLINEGMSYNQAYSQLYEQDEAWLSLATWQKASFEEIQALQTENETAAHRSVGLVVETRPDAVDANTFAHLRRLGATKVQMGIQSLDEKVLKANRRSISVRDIRRAFELARLFGFKTHAHFMLNLLGADPESDKRDYQRLIEDKAIVADEIKLYPCALVEGTDLVKHYKDGSWKPYSEAQLVEVLASDLLHTPAYTRISRMIRDIPAQDILCGNKKINLRQMVEKEAQRLAQKNKSPLQEIRSREIGVEGTDDEKLQCKELRYETSISTEVFLEWVDEKDRIAGFLRLSLPHPWALSQTCTDLLGGKAAIAKGEAMIREVHVYGSVAGLHRNSPGAQHKGLGRSLIARACEIAKEAGYTSLKVISAVGTRPYYRSLGFDDGVLYQCKSL